MGRWAVMRPPAGSVSLVVNHVGAEAVEGERHLLQIGQPVAELGLMLLVAIQQQESASPGSEQFCRPVAPLCLARS